MLRDPLLRLWECCFSPPGALNKGWLFLRHRVQGLYIMQGHLLLLSSKDGEAMQRETVGSFLSIVRGRRHTDTVQSVACCSLHLTLEFHRGMLSKGMGNMQHSNATHRNSLGNNASLQHRSRSGFFQYPSKPRSLRFPTSSLGKWCRGRDDNKGLLLG